ncbi:unnamed protein product [Brachionus calyciflorus]|uniref:Uncharacterized protein n=1 Tax=Brachionus calyciflorus TaxID=104777 RepID=A0A813PKD1_9BILA|nr:unnamed protein product [Brachionus calyciflorus]
MNKSKQVVKQPVKKETVLPQIKNANLESDFDYLDINNGDLEPLSDTLDFKNLLTQSYDISKAIATNTTQTKTNQFNDLFMLDTNKLARALKCNAFYKAFDYNDDFLIKNYFDERLIDMFDKKETFNRANFDEIYHKIHISEEQFVKEPESANLLQQKQDSTVKKTEEILLKPVETKEQNIDDWLDELID